MPEAQGKQWRSVNNVGEALDDVISGRSTAGMIAIENSIEGGVSVAQDALATIPGLREGGTRHNRGAYSQLFEQDQYDERKDNGISK